MLPSLFATEGGEGGAVVGLDGEPPVAEATIDDSIAFVTYNGGRCEETEGDCVRGGASGGVPPCDGADATDDPPPPIDEVLLLPRAPPPPPPPPRWVMLEGLGPAPSTMRSKPLCNIAIVKSSTEAVVSHCTSASPLVLEGTARTVGRC